MLRPTFTSSFTGQQLSRGQTPTVVGRGIAGILDTRLSREHVRFTDEGAGFAVTALGRNGVELHPAGGASSTVVKPGDASQIIRNADEISLLPGHYRFALDLPPEAPPPPLEEPAAKKQRSGEIVASAAAGSGGCGSSSSSGGGGGSGSGGDVVDDWEYLDPFPSFNQPPKPSYPAGLDALSVLAQRPETQPQRNIFLQTNDFIVAYDLYPKAKVHLLVLPRKRIDSPTDLSASDAPLVKSMGRLGKYLARNLRARDSSLAPFGLGFHAAPSMRQLHLHVISLDLDSECLKHKKHWNSFATGFLVPPEVFVQQLEGAEGKVASKGHAVEEARLKADMLCPVSGAPLKNMPAVKARLKEAAYLEALRAAAGGRDVVRRWPLV